MSESSAQRNLQGGSSRKAKSTFLHEGSFGCAYTPPVPCKKSKYKQKVKTKLVGKILPKVDVDAELSLTTLIKTIPHYEDYYIVPEEEECDARNFFLARDDLIGDCKLFQRTRNKDLAQLVSPFGGTALHKIQYGPGFDYIKSLKHLLRAVAQLHNVGIVHFDLHMANVLLDAKGVLRIIDFGISFALPNLTQRMIEDRQVEFSPGYAVEAPDLTLQRAIVQNIPLDKAIDMILNEKKVLQIAASILGLSLVEQKESLRRFFYEDRSMRERNWFLFYKSYAFKWDSWCVGMIFMYILQDLLLQTWFVTNIWNHQKEKIKTVLRGLLRTNPQQRISAAEALHYLNDDGV